MNHLKTNIRELVREVADEIYHERDAVAVLVREPLIDIAFPKSSDVDMIVVDLSNDLSVENIRRNKNGVRFDIMGFSANLLLHDDFLRYAGTYPHQLVACSVVRETGNYGTMIINRMKDLINDPTSLYLRINNHIKFANQFITMAERCKDCREGFFYLNPAASGFIATLCDGKTSLINVLSKPYLKIARVEPKLIDWFNDVLKLNIFNVDVLKELGDFTCSEYANVRLDLSRTNREFRTSISYFIHPEEVKYRLKVIEEMNSKGDFVDATHYGRIYAYTLMAGMYFRDHFDEVDQKTSFLRHGQQLNNVRGFEIFEKLFPISKGEFEESLERVKIFRRRKLCPILTSDE